MRTGNRKAAYDILVAFEKLIRENVTSIDSLRESVVRFFPKMFDRTPMSTNNFRAFYINDADLSKIKELTTVERRWEDKFGKTYVRKTKRLTNRRLVQRALDDWSDEGWEYRKDVSLENAIVRQLSFLGVQPFETIYRKINVNEGEEMKEVLVPKKWVYDTKKYTID